MRFGQIKANISRFWLIFFDFENILGNNYAPFGCNYAPDWCIFFCTLSS